MISSLLVGLIVIAIFVVIVGTILKLVPMPAPIPIIVWCIVTVFCLLVLLSVIRGGSIGIHL